NKDKLDSLLVHRDFFQLKKELQSPAYDSLPVFRKLYYQAFLHNFFHDLTTSNEEINLLLNKYKNRFGVNEMSNLLLKKIDNHVKLYQYKQAHITSQVLLSKDGVSLTGAERKDAMNSDIIWKGLQHI